MAERKEDVRYRRTAAYYRGALALGLTEPAQVVSWADGLIEHEATVPDALYDVSLATSRSRWELYSTLRALTSFELEEAESLLVARALLDTLWQDVRNGRRAVNEAVDVLRGMQRLAMPDTLRYQLSDLEENYSLAADGIRGTLPSMDREVRQFLAGFEGAASALLPPAA